MRNVRQTNSSIYVLHHVYFADGPHKNCIIRGGIVLADPEFSEGRGVKLLFWPIFSTNCVKIKKKIGTAWERGFPWQTWNNFIILSEAHCKTWQNSTLLEKVQIFWTSFGQFWVLEFCIWNSFERRRYAFSQGLIMGSQTFNPMIPIFASMRYFNKNSSW